MRRRYRWNPKTLRQEPIDDVPSGSGITIIPDIEPFVSPVDKTVITGRKALRDHNKRHNVTNIADFTETWKQSAKERERFLGGDTSFDSKRRTEHLREAYDKLRRR